MPDTDYTSSMKRTDVVATLEELKAQQRIEDNKDVLSARRKLERRPYLRQVVNR